MKKIFFMSLLIVSLTFTGCSSQNNTNTVNNNTSKTSEDTVSNQYNVSGYWKVSSQELDNGYYIVEFKANNTMVEYFPKNNILESTYEVKNSSIDNLTILTSSNTLINLQKVDDFNMTLLYDSVIEHATKISKTDFNKLLNDLSQYENETTVYNSSYYNEYDENYTNVEENYTSIEHNNVSVEENYTNIEQTEIDIDQNNTSIEQNNTNVEENNTNIEENNTNVEIETSYEYYDEDGNLYYWVICPTCGDEILSNDISVMPCHNCDPDSFNSLFPNGY